ncbi:hypothetical protein GCM10009591_37410 [Brachybacterium tyrofermentans]
MPADLAHLRDNVLHADAVGSLRRGHDLGVAVETVDDRGRHVLRSMQDAQFEGRIFKYFTQPAGLDMEVDDVAHRDREVTQGAPAQGPAGAGVGTRKQLGEATHVDVVVVGERAGASPGDPVLVGQVPEAGLENDTKRIRYRRVSELGWHITADQAGDTWFG